MSRIEQLIDDLEDYVDSCKLVPLSNTKISVNREELMEMISDLRISIPNELTQYQKIISNKDAILEEAKQQAQRLLDAANEKTEQLISQDEIMQEAYRRADKLVDDASTQAQSIVENATFEANNIRNSALQYTDDLLKNLQSIMMNSIDGSKAKFEQFISNMESNLNTVTENRNQLSSSLVEVYPDELLEE